MKKFTMYLLLMLFILTGCSKSSETMLTFSDYEGDFSYGSSGDYEKPSFANTFAKDLCIISKDVIQTKDSNLVASSSLLVNSVDNNIIYSDNVYERLYPASITKIITALVVLKHADLTDTVTFSYNASHITESGAKLCGFKEGDTIVLGDLLKALLVYSGNDAGIAIAEHVGQTEEGFADMMNKEMKAIGAVDSNFVNAHGLHDDNHYTTAYDLYLVFNELVKDEHFLSIISTSSVTVSYKNKDEVVLEKIFENTNRYLKGTESTPDGLTIIGGKTGTTYKAGSCLILYSKDTKDKNYISLILNATSGDNLFQQMTYLLKLIK